MDKNRPNGFKHKIELRKLNTITDSFLLTITKTYLGNLNAEIIEILRSPNIIASVHGDPTGSTETHFENLCPHRALVQNGSKLIS